MRALPALIWLEPGTIRFARASKGETGAEWTRPSAPREALGGDALVD
jgi:hypothetical protein